MYVSSVKITDYRAFSGVEIELGQMNVFVGANNAGKSSILKALYLMQQGGGLPYSDVRIGTRRSIVRIVLSSVNEKDTWFQHFKQSDIACQITLTSPDRRMGSQKLAIHAGGAREAISVDQLPASVPHHFVVPYLSRRKTSSYLEDVKREYAERISPDMVHLAARLSRLGNPSFPGHAWYVKTCTEILGYAVTTVTSENGQRPGVYLENEESITIDQMGEGVPNIVCLLADLATSQGKLFLIEEPENDLHPAALKSLLNLIQESSSRNQFVVSTHSSIVVSHLGALENSKLYQVSSRPGQLPPSATVDPVESSPRARLAVLRDLGYSMADFDLWDGWLILEEASAERLIRDYLIPWFAPKLSRLRTISTGGVTNIEPTLADFNRMILFTHLQDAYEGMVWVRADGDEAGKHVVSSLRDRYRSWNPNRFNSFKEASFEKYYPRAFGDEVTAALGIRAKMERREAKQKLVLQVVAWLDSDEERGRLALEDSARDVIADLRIIESELMEKLRIGHVEISREM